MQSGVGIEACNLILSAAQSRLHLTDLDALVEASVSGHGSHRLDDFANQATKGVCVRKNS